MYKTGKWILFVLQNAVIVILLVIFQFLLFGFLPSINPELPAQQQISEAIDFVLEQDLLLLCELAVGLAAGFLINKYMFQLFLKKNIRTLLSIFIIVVSSGLFISLNYIHKFPVNGQGLVK